VNDICLQLIILVLDVFVIGFDLSKIPDLLLQLLDITLLSLAEGSLRFCQTPVSYLSKVPISHWGLGFRSKTRKAETSGPRPRPHAARVMINRKGSTPSNTLAAGRGDAVLPCHNQENGISDIATLLTTCRDEGE
jgi:hypothetical protein